MESRVGLQVCSIFSIILDSFVVITMLIFPSMRKNKIFMEIVAMIAFANIMGNISYAMGIFPKNGTRLCQFQGFCIMFFFPVSWMFTLMLAYLLRGLAYTGRLYLLRHHVYILCWGLPFLLVILRLSTNTYGVESQLEYTSVCTYGGSNIEAGFLWESIAFCGLLLCLCFLMVFWFAEIQYLQNHKSSTATSITFRIAKETLFWYPVLLIVCWLPYSMYIIYKGPHISKMNSTGFDIMLRSLKNLCGGLTASMFFWKCKEAQLRWWLLLFPLLCPKRAKAAAEAAAARRSISAGGAGMVMEEWEDEYEDAITPTDDVMQTKITSTRLDPVNLAAALEAQGALDASDGAMGAATTNTLHSNGNPKIGMDLESVILKKSNELMVGGGKPSTNNPNLRSVTFSDESTTSSSTQQSRSSVDSGGSAHSLSPAIATAEV